MPASPNETSIPETERSGSSPMTKEAGKFALIFTTLLALGIIVLVYFLVSVIEAKNVSTASGHTLVEACPPTTCPTPVLRLLMEQDAQNLRTDRFRSALTTRLVVHVVAEVIALVLVVLGSVLIFDRIESDREQGLGIQTGDSTRQPSIWAQFYSSFPGLFLAAFGAGVISWSLWIIAQPYSRVSVHDYPIFIEDVNLARNLLGYVSRQEPGTPEIDKGTAESNISRAFEDN